MNANEAPDTVVNGETAPTPHTDEAHRRAADNQDSVAVYICTHERNEPLQRLLGTLDRAAGEVEDQIDVAVVVVDDNPDGRAKQVADRWATNNNHHFTLGVHYRHTGSQNISTARNMGVETALGLADWVAMTDDDQTVSPQWLQALFDAAEKHNADAVTGPALINFHESAPSWINEQPFDDILEAQDRIDGERVDTCSTGNSMIKSEWLKEHPHIRFRKDLGTVGGEDMVFYRAAIKDGLQAYYAMSAEVYQMHPRERSNFGYLLRSAYWLGNTEYLTNYESGMASRKRLTLRGAKRLLKASIRPVRQAAAGKPPQWRYGAALAAQACGILVGVAGVKVKHQ